MGLWPKLLLKEERGCFWTQRSSNEQAGPKPEVLLTVAIPLTTLPSAAHFPVISSLSKDQDWVGASGADLIQWPEPTVASDVLHHLGQVAGVH